MCHWLILGGVEGGSELNRAALHAPRVLCAPLCVCARALRPLLSACVCVCASLRVRVREGGTQRGEGERSGKGTKL